MEEQINFTYEDFLQIQKTIKKIKHDPARYYLSQLRIKKHSSTSISVSFSCGRIAIDKVYRVYVKTDIEDEFSTVIHFNCIKSISLEKDEMVHLCKKEGIFYLTTGDQKIKCYSKGILPDIHNFTSQTYREPCEIALNLKLLNTFCSLKRDVILRFNKGEKGSPVTILDCTGEKLGVIMPIKY